ncbi:MAG: zinc ribbon domain-containing protein [Elusimicrobia bacterium]|nr:zinc ribbon domain-containing protein [Elusimicrobiota bacterium]
MKCPNCGVEAPAGATDCPACGVIFAKFKKKLESLPVPEPARFDPWVGRAIAAAIVAIWMIAFGLYYRRAVSEMPVRNPAGPAGRR